MTRKLFAMLFSVGVLSAAASTASAGDFGFSFNYDGGHYGGCHSPVYYYPERVYYREPAVYYREPVVYARPAPVVIYDRPVYHRTYVSRSYRSYPSHRHYYHHGHRSSVRVRYDD